MPTCLFVYGTLMPGHLRWGLLAGSATTWSEASVTGQLYDTDRGWPAARFGGEGVISGWAVEVPVGTLDALLPLLDVEEGEGFERVVIELAGGRPAWSYAATTVEGGWRRIDAWAGEAER